MSESAVHLVSMAEAQSFGGFRPMLLGPETGHSDNFDLPVQPNQSVIDDPYARGLEEGQRMAETVFEIERSRLQKLLASAEAVQSEPSEELAVLISEAVHALVCEIVGNAPIDEEWLNIQAKRASALVAECDAARTMWVHPEDLPLIDEAGVGLKLRSDPNAERGSMRIDCSEGWIEHGRALYLDQLRSEFGLKGTEA